MPASVPKGSKLVLKDGTIQYVRSYQIQGDRVRFYSVERSAWEEIPTALVDWEATHKAESEDTKRDQELVEKLREEKKAELAASIDVDASIQVGPGIFLPPGEGLFLLDGKALLPLIQAESKSKLSKGRLMAQVLIPVPVVPGRHIVYVPGERATFRIENSTPEFYVRTADGHEPEIELIRARVKGKNRQIEYIDNYLGVRNSTSTEAVSLERWQLAKGVFRLTLSQSLEPGEYVLAELLPKEGMNVFVWDFGVNASAKTAPPSRK